MSHTKLSSQDSKSKLLSDLFDDSTDTKSKTDSTMDTKRNNSKSDINFGDASDLLATEPSPRKTSDSGYLDTLLGQSSTTKPVKNKSKEFVLPDKYASSGNDQNEEKESSSRNKRPGSSVVGGSFEEFFSDTSSRLRRPSPQTSKNRSVENDGILNSPKSNQRENSSTKENDWLFSSSPAKLQSSRKVIEDISKEPNNPPPKGKDSSGSLNEEDWLSKVLSTANTSPVKNAVTSKSNQLGSNSSQAGITLSSNVDVPHTQAPIKYPLISGFAVAHAQQQELENQRLHQIQVQMKEQQEQMMNQIMASHQQQVSFSSLLPSNSSFHGENDESIKQLKVDLHKAETEVGRLQAELDLIREQHENQIHILRTSFTKKEDMEEEVWKKKEEHLMEQMEEMKQNHNSKFKEIQKERETLISCYEDRISATKAEMVEALHRSKELYGAVVDRMKSEHQSSVERLVQIKDVELKAALSASGHVKEFDSVLNQLESNASELSHISSAVSQKHDSAIEMNKKALEFKEKQLKALEDNLGLVKAELESERNRLTVLVNRLETSLANQGTEVESQKWALAQEKMKIDVERNSLREEKRHFQLMMQSERNDLTHAKESLLREEDRMVREIVKRKSELFSMENHKRLDNTDSFGMEEEKRHLWSKTAELKILEKRLKEEKRILESKKLKFEEDFDKNTELKESLELKKRDLEERTEDIERREKKMEEQRERIQRKLNEVTRETQKLRIQQENLAKDRAMLEYEQERMSKHYSQNYASCATKSLGGRGTSLGLGDLLSSTRIPGDGREIMGREVSSQKNFEPSAVLERLKLAWEEESRAKEKQKIRANMLVENKIS